VFDVGFSELLLCFVVALVVLGPERLPGLARSVGRWTGQAKSYLRNLSAELDRESQIAELKKQLHEASKVLKDETAAMKDSAQKLVDDTRKP
jgi:sec-independent protein translocase protein TatB